jgi:hypothetical protein
MLHAVFSMVTGVSRDNSRPLTAGLGNRYNCAHLKLTLMCAAIALLLLPLPPQLQQVA